MVSKYDVFYAIAVNKNVTIKQVSDLLGKRITYKATFNHIVTLEQEGYLKRTDTINLKDNKQSKQLFKLISFCLHNQMNYNLLFRDKFLSFIEKVAKKEYFASKDVRIDPDTFLLYTSALSQYGLLLIISKKPFVGKILKHAFFVELLTFFKKSTRFYKSTSHDRTESIKKAFREYKRQVVIDPTLPARAQQRENKFIHASLHLEGNPITLSDTEKIIEEEIVPQQYRLLHVQEVTNYKQAVDVMIEQAAQETALSQELILEYHTKAMAHIHGAGVFREQNVRIKGNPNFKTTQWQLVPSQIAQLMQEYNEFIAQKRKVDEIITFAAFFHNQFQRIHPFIDGNSRTARLLLLHVLRQYGLPVLDLPLGYFDLYMDLTKRSKTRDDKAFRDLVEELVLFNLKQVLRMKLV